VQGAHLLFAQSGAALFTGHTVHYMYIQYLIRTAQGGQTSEVLATAATCQRPSAVASRRGGL
jgi:hypothetical protein